MKIHTALIVSGLMISGAFAQNVAQQAETAYAKGVAAEKAGDPVSARTHYASALKANPNHANARYSIGQLKLNAGAIAAKGREAKFGEVMVPAFQLDNATLQEALLALSIIVEKQSKDEVAPNFVIEDPKNQFAERRITLNLKNLPARGVMKYLTDQVSAKVRYDEHAVVLAPR